MSKKVKQFLYYFTPCWISGFLLCLSWWLANFNHYYLDWWYYKDKTL